jgi:hypothetical protein
MTPEGEVVRACLDYLEIRGIKNTRMNTGRRGGVSYGSEGWPDIIGCLPGGRFFAIECKAGRGKLSPEQVKFQRDIIRQGGLHIVAYRVEDVIEVLQAEGF